MTDISLDTLQWLVKVSNLFDARTTRYNTHFRDRPHENWLQKNANVYSKSNYQNCMRAKG